MKPHILFLLLPLLCHCGGRSVTGVAGNGARADGAVGKDLVSSDVARLDTSAGDLTKSFCTGKSRFAINGQGVTQPSVVANVGVTNLCGTHTLYVRLNSATGSAPRELQFYLCLDGVDPDASLIKMKDAASHMARAMIVPCATSNCTLHHKKDADFSGQASLNLKGATPGVTMDLCVEAKAKTPTGSLKSFSIWLGNTELKQSCQRGSDASCNHSLNVSALRGKCEKDGTCTCLPGAKKVLASGKCL